MKGITISSAATAAACCIAVTTASLPPPSSTFGISRNTIFAGLDSRGGAVGKFHDLLYASSFGCILSMRVVYILLGDLSFHII